MDHHGLYTDISNSFPGGANGPSGGLPNTNVKYHHHLPQIPPQPPPQEQQQGGQQGYLAGSYGGQQQQNQQQVQSGQLQQQQQQHVEPDPIGCGLFTDTAGLFDPASALCTNNISSNSFSTNNNHQGANNSKTVEFTSRKFETNTGDSITYNINNINTNIVNNISGGSLGGTGGVQTGINQAQAIVGATTDFLGGAQFAPPTGGGGVGGGSGNTQISFNKDGDSNPTIINISNNNHNIMAPPYPYSYPTKISGMGALNELNSKFGANHSWSAGSNATGTATVGHEFGHENTVISNFESKNPNKYHTSRSSYRYQQDYTGAQQPQHAAHYQHKQPQPTTHYQPSYGLYHPEGAQATPIHQPNGHHHGYHEPFPHIVRSKYPTATDEASRYGRSHHGHQHSSTNHSQTHHDLMYNERSRHTANYASGYVPPAPGSYYASHQPSTKGIIGPNLEFFNSGYLKQMPTMNHHYLPPNRHAYAAQPTAHHNYHHQNYPVNPNPTYEDPYHHRSRIPAVPHHYKDHHAQQQYPNYPNAHSNLTYHQTQPTQVFNKTFADYGAPNVALNPSHHYNNPTTPTVHHQPNHYGIKYTSQTIVPPMTQPRQSSSSAQQQPLQKPTQPANNTYYTTPNPVSFDLNHPLIDLEDQINSVKILKTNREPTVPQSFDANHAINYDCHQKYMMNRYLSNKPNPSSSSIPDANGYIPNGLITGNNTVNPTNFGYTTMEDLGLGARGFTLDENLKDKNLRDYLSSWNETEEEEAEKKEANNNQPAHQNFESCKYLQEALEEQLPPLPHSGVIVANVQNGNLPDILVDLDKPKDEQPPKPATGQEQTEVGERLYILETYDVPHSELNKYKHLSVINELPKNVVPIHDSADSLKFLEEIESNRDKYYQTELESEVVYDDRKKEDDKKEPTPSTDQTVPETIQTSTEPTPPPQEQVKEPEEAEETFKVPRHLPKYRKRQRHLEQQQPQYDYPRFPKRARRSSIEDFLNCDKPKVPVPVVPKRYHPKQLLTLCVAALNSREYRRYAKANIARREQLKRELEEERKLEEKARMEVEAVEEAVQMEEASEVTGSVVDLTESVEESAVEDVKVTEAEEATLVEERNPDESTKQVDVSETVDDQEMDQVTTTEDTEAYEENMQEHAQESSEERVENIQACVENKQECVEDTQVYADKAQECIEDEQERVEDMQACVEEKQECVEDSQECVEDIQEFVDSTQECMENTKECVVDTQAEEKHECLEDIQENADKTKECVEDALERVENKQECVEDIQEYVDSTQERVEDAQECVEDAQECVEVIQEYVESTKDCVEDAPKQIEDEPECVEDIQEYVDSTQEDTKQCVEDAKQCVKNAKESVEDAVCDIAEEQTKLDADQSDEDDDVFEAPVPITNRVSVIVEETRQGTTPPLSSVLEESCPSPVPEPVIEGQRVPVIQRLESVEVMEVELEAVKEEVPKVELNPNSLKQLTAEAFERYSQVYDYQRVPSLRTLCYEYLLESGMLPQPETLQKLCEQFICNNRQLFIIEEVRHEPERLQDICQKVVNETNIIIDMNDFCIMTSEEMAKQDKEDEGRVFIVEDNHGSIVDLLREDDEDEVGTEVMEISEDHEIFLGTVEAGDDGIRVVLESNHSDSENEIYRKVEQEIEKMMTTSSDEDDEGVKEGVIEVDAVDEQELQNEFFSFVGDDCIQYEEVVPVNKVAYRRESLIKDLRERYVGGKEGSFSCRLKLLRKYVYYQRYIRLKEGGVASKKRFFRKRLACLEKKIAAMRRKPVVEEVDSDSNSSMSSVSSSSSSSSSASSSEASSTSSSDSEEEAVTEVETFQQSEESASEETSNQSDEPIETNNNRVEQLPKPAQQESQQFAKEQEDSNSSDSRSRGQLRRSPNVLPLAKKKKLSFEESLLNIEQIYKKSGSPTPSSIGSPNSSNSCSSSSNSRPMSRRFSTNCRPNVIVNVNNNREAPRKLFIPSYKIFDQTMSAKLQQLSTEVTPSRSLSRSSSGSSSSSSRSSSVSTKQQVTTSTQRSSGLIRVNYPKKPSTTTTAKEVPVKRSRAPSTNGTPDLDHRIPFVRLERIDYVEKLAEQYRKQQLQQDQQTKFTKLRQRRKSTFS